MASTTAIRSVAAKLSTVLQADGFAGWDPYDALTAPAIHSLARSRLTRGAAIQILKRSPVNPRRLLGVPKQSHTKALALLVSAYSNLARVDSSGRYEELAANLADHLAGRAIPFIEGAAFAYDFDVQTRWGYYRAGQPNAVATAFAAHALLDAGSLTGNESYFELARATATFATSRLLVERENARFFAYVQGSKVPIHNASVLIAGVCARCTEPGSVEWAAADDAMRYTLGHQREDGSWPYGEQAGLEWVDGFHTAYVLESLARWHAATGDEAVETAITRGLDLYLKALIERDGLPRASIERRYPVDIHAASSAVTALSRLDRYSPWALLVAERVLDWTLRRMSRSDGRFAYQLHRYHRNSTPYIRWNDSHMLLALSSYLRALEGDSRQPAQEETVGI
jgi:hypothetical protein